MILALLTTGCVFLQDRKAAAAYAYAGTAAYNMTVNNEKTNPRINPLPTRVSRDMGGVEMNLTSLFPKMSPAIEDAILEYAPRYGIGEREMPMFLAQAGHESGEFTVFVESLNYSTSALLSLFGRHRISVADAQAFGRNTSHAANQEAIANCIYGGAWGAKNLGNTELGDGWKYRGRGIFQLTGRANYQAFQDAHPDIPVMENPDILVEPAEAVISACWFWKSKNLNWYGSDIVAATKAINGGQNGLAHRKLLFARLS